MLSWVLSWKQICTTHRVLCLLCRRECCKSTSSIEFPVRIRPKSTKSTTFDDLSLPSLTPPGEGSTHQPHLALDRSWAHLSAARSAVPNFQQNWPRWSILLAVQRGKKGDCILELYGTHIGWFCCCILLQFSLGTCLKMEFEEMQIGFLMFLANP